ncbi:uncharacterized protein J3R85_017702 [Psidium guajava]|nr:uncharacterized protein J3R85_017702 [Psidium guajava]
MGVKSGVVLRLHRVFWTTFHALVRNKEIRTVQAEIRRASDVSREPWTGGDDGNVNWIFKADGPTTVKAFQWRNVLLLLCPPSCTICRPYAISLSLSLCKNWLLCLATARGRVARKQMRKRVPFEVASIYLPHLPPSNSAPNFFCFSSLPLPL